MKRFTLILATLLISLSALADKPQKGSRDQWDREMLEFRHEYFAKELALRDDQKTAFFALHDKMVEERRAVRREVRAAKEELKKKGNAATQADYDRVANLEYELKGRENDIEMRYYEQFKKILTPEQLYKLKDVERAYAQLIRDQYRHGKKKK